MLAYLFNRLGYSLLILWGVVTLVFFLFNVLPGDPARLTMGQRSDQASIDAARKQLKLDQPVLLRYIHFINDLSPVSFYSKDTWKEHSSGRALAINEEVVVAFKLPYLGKSYRTKKEVSAILLDALPGTLILATSAMFIASILGILLGMLAALKKDSWWDTGAVAASVSGISLPSFFAGLLIAYFFGYLLHPYTGLNMTGSLWVYDPFEGKKLALQNLILPAIALGIRPMAIITQLTRSAMLDVLQQDFMRTAYAKGLTKTQALFRHALPNALNPVLTAISGWMAELLAGSFFVEFIFGWKGVGKITVDALEKFDFPVVMGAVLLSAFIFIVVNLITDLLYTRLDPRVRLG